MAQYRPYDDITVLNVSRSLAGGMAAQLLAGLGARVVRVEEPDKQGTQLPSRDVLAGWDVDGDLFAHFGRGSESVALDLDTTGGRAALRALAKHAQVIMEDERPADERGVRDALRATRQEDGAAFTLASVTPFGLEGPWMDLPASELLIFAMSGLMAQVGEPEREPVTLPGWLVQGHVGLASFSAIASTLPVDGSPVASHDLDVAYLDVVANSNPHAISGYSYTGHIERRQGGRLLDGYPWTVLPCQDGFIGIIVPQSRWDVFCLWMDRPDLIVDERFHDRVARKAHADELDQVLIEWASTQTKDELYMEGQARGLPFGAVYTVADSLNSAHLATRDFFDEVPGPDGNAVRYAGLPYVFDGERPKLGSLAPHLGEHTQAVLAEFGVTAQPGCTS